MADDYDLSLQVGVLATLEADVDLAALVGARIYDELPNDPTYPNIVFGGFIVRPEDTNCAEYASIRFTIEVHSRPVAGSTEARRIAATVRKALHKQEAAVTVEGFRLVELIYQLQTVDRNRDGESYLGKIVFKAFMQPA